MNLFKNKKTQSILKPVDGVGVNISDVNDEVFSSKAMGDGVGIIPNNGDITSPVSGKVVALFPTNHAIGIETIDGIEILIHIGINTVELNGEGFSAHVSQGQKVKRGESLITFDLDFVKESYDPTVMVIITNTNEKDITFLLDSEDLIATVN